ncbi:ExbD/TolR family protein [Caulobacter rhizosphaerae]|uniref:ExbD/TolR family protein n=1 Tax=Caulobacter rhizosphaerae TaxID=2010972 RepID=UPI0013CF47E1|nr:biopolymer transporter ExbD [Caulobacter rhizosphaerae]GGL47704.1 biopolymer transporter [Caulobacter rhizosphaerae]
MGWKRILGLVLASIVLALVVWGLFLPLTTVSIKVDLPPAAPPAKPKTVDVYIAPDGSLRVDDRPSSLEGLPRDIQAQAATADRSGQRVMLHAGREVKYGVFSPVLERVRGAGWSHVGWVADETSEPTKPFGQSR